LVFIRGEANGEAVNRPDERDGFGRRTRGLKSTALFLALLVARIFLAHHSDDASTADYFAALADSPH
jgi:hypothetical protein